MKFPTINPLLAVAVLITITIIMAVLIYSFSASWTDYTPEPIQNNTTIEEFKTLCENTNGYLFTANVGGHGQSWICTCPDYNGTAQVLVKDIEWGGCE